MQYPGRIRNGSEFSGFKASTNYVIFYFFHHISKNNGENFGIFVALPIWGRKPT